MNLRSRNELDLNLQRWDEKLGSHLKLVDERICSETALFAQWRESEHCAAGERHRALVDAVQEKHRVADERHRELVDAVHEIQVEGRQGRDEMKAESKSLKIVTITTAIGAVIAIVGGIAAFNATVLSNMLAAFESGINVAERNSPASPQSKPGVIH